MLFTGRALVSRFTRHLILSNPFQHAHLKRCLTKSSVEGPLEPPLSTKTLPQYFETEILDRYHARPALICRQEAARAHGGPPTQNLGRQSIYLAWSFEEFDWHINALARGLLSMGVQTGDRVGVIMGNNRYEPVIDLFEYSMRNTPVRMQCFNGHAPALVPF